MSSTDKLDTISDADLQRLTNCHQATVAALLKANEKIEQLEESKDELVDPSMIADLESVALVHDDPETQEQMGAFLEELSVEIERVQTSLGETHPAASHLERASKALGELYAEYDVIHRTA